MYTDIQQIKNTIIHAGNGKIIKLKDIAKVELDYKGNESFARFNGEKAVWISVQQKKDQNIYRLTDNILSEIEAFELEMPHDVKLHKVVVQQESVKKRVNQFTGNFLQGMVLVGLIIFLAMGGLLAIHLEFRILIFR